MMNKAVEMLSQYSKLLYFCSPKYIIAQKNSNVSDLL